VARHSPECSGYGKRHPLRLEWGNDRSGGQWGDGGNEPSGDGGSVASGDSQDDNQRLRTFIGIVAVAGACLVVLFGTAIIFVLFKLLRPQSRA
jgi:hypothetical protein